MSAASDGQLLGMGILLQISRRVRDAARLEEIGFIAVNESKQLLNYRQAALWVDGKGVCAVSGIPEPDQSAPYIQWLSAAFGDWRKGSGCRRTAPDDLSPLLSRAWSDWLPSQAVIAPFTSKSGAVFALLLLVREDPWEEHELALLGELSSIYSHGLRALIPVEGYRKRIGRLFSERWGRMALALLLFGALFYPVRMSVQAPAEIVPKDPFVVRSPLEGVIDRFHVRPNEPVTQGQLLFEFDRTNLRARLGVAGKSFEVAAEEYRQAAQQALLDDRGRAEVMPRRGRMEEKATELSYSRQLLQRVEVRAPRPGIAVFAEQSDWVGKNVAVGERVLVIADAAKVEILIHLPVADAIDLTLGTPVTLYLATDPQHPRTGRLRYASYKPEVTASGIAAYRLKADMDEGSGLPRIGLAGTARIYGKDVTLAYFLFRRPLTALRQGLGW
ncbi:MAG: HlyD family efflux transporter periplasmic adaptor subunit [Deltaproteobacteria bacterium]|nr:HlyD family efflux transporter periplasmic adaptor subunit [Deltaproteobacteria bacterium]